MKKNLFESFKDPKKKHQTWTISKLWIFWNGAKHHHLLRHHSWHLLGTSVLTKGWMSNHFPQLVVGILVNPTMLHQHNSCHISTAGLRKEFQKRGFGKLLQLWKSYEFVSSDRADAAWTISFSEKRAAVSLCRDETCLWDVDNLRWSWRSPESDLSRWFSSSYSKSFPWGVSLPFGHVRYMLPNWAKLRFHSAWSPVSKHKTLFRLSILLKKMTLPLRIKYNMQKISVISSEGLFSTMVSTSLKVYISDFEETPHSKNSNNSASPAPRSTFSHDYLECNNLNHCTS